MPPKKITKPKSVKNVKPEAKQQPKKPAQTKQSNYINKVFDINNFDYKKL